MQEMICNKCKLNMCYAADSDEDADPVNFTIKCRCGEVNKASFFGYPKLWGTPDIYFDFTDEFEITCKTR